jgi:hypothetical protein
MDNELSLEAEEKLSQTSKSVSYPSANSFVNNDTVVLKIGTAIRKCLESND